MHNGRMCTRVWGLVAGGLAALLGTGCVTSGSGDGFGNSPAELARKAQILAEPQGNYFVGRRYHIDRTRFWGYVRRPRQSWKTSKLVVMNEAYKRVPDRLPELPAGTALRFSYDHNYEYKLYGRYSGRKVYDPNANLFLPEFMLTGYELLDPEPGWLFEPRERNDPSQLPFLPRQ